MKTYKITLYSDFNENEIYYIKANNILEATVTANRLLEESLNRSSLYIKSNSSIKELN